VLVGGERAADHGRVRLQPTREPFFDRRTADDHVVAAFAQNREPSMSGQVDRAGNGAAMRIGPTAVALADLPDEAFVDRLVAVSLITHREIRALAGMLAIAYLARIMGAASRYPPKRESAQMFASGLVPWLREQEDRLALCAEVVSDQRTLHEISDALANGLEVWDEGWPVVAGRIAAFATERRGSLTSVGEGFVTASVVTSVLWSLMSISMLPETLVGAVGLGGDTDTVAAMVGGIAGPGTHRVSIPKEWLKFTGREELLALSRCLDSGGSADGSVDLVELETRLTRIVRQGLPSMA